MKFPLMKYKMLIEATQVSFSLRRRISRADYAQIAYHVYNSGDLNSKAWQELLAVRSRRAKETFSHFQQPRMRSCIHAAS